MRKLITLLGILAISTIAYAASYTTYYSLYKPAQGDRNWGTQINANFDTIDTTLYAKADSSDVDADLALKVDLADVGVADGVASLGSDGKVPSAQLPSSLTGALVYSGVLDASGGAYPGSPSQGDYYVISVAGTIDGTGYDIGDWAVYNGSSWDKIDNSASSSGFTDSGIYVTLLTPTDNVGLGTTAPTSKLQVVGTVTATAFSGALTGAVTGNASTSTALAANGSNCSAGEYPLGVDASGAVESCTDATTEIDSAITTHNAVTSAHSATSTNTASRIVLRDASGAFSAGVISASLSGNATTATSLASNPTDCSAGQYASSIDAAGNLTCATPAGTISGLTTNYVTKATSATAIGNSLIYDNGTNVGIGSTSPTQKLEVVGTIKATAFSGNASTATALAANGTNCTTGTYPLGVDASGNAESCEAVTGVDLTALDQGVYFDSSNVYDIGDSTNRVGEIHVEGGIYGYGSGINYFASNVGIGSTVPQGALDVNGAIYGTTFFGNGAYLTGISAGSANPTANSVPKSTGSSLVDSTLYDVNGNVGIGSTTPRGLLDVKGTTKQTFIDGYIYEGGTATLQQVQHQIYAIANSASVPILGINNNSNAGIINFYSNASGDGEIRIKNSAGTTKFTLNSNGVSHFAGGNVGIGTTTAGTALLEVGTTGQLKVSSTGGLTMGGTGGLTISDTTAAGSCTSSASTTCTATVRSGCNPVCSQTTSVSTTLRCSVATTTLTCTFGTSGTNTCNFVCF